MQQGSSFLKPSFDEWMRWVDVVTDRLTEVSHVYSAPPYPDAYMVDSTRQTRLARTVGFLRSYHSAVEKSHTLQTQSPEQIAANDEDVISNFVILTDELLTFMPTVSENMQFLLKSSWVDNCTGRKATTIFRGARDDLHEGIGSGLPENGRLPEVLTDMLEREQVGETRPERKPIDTSSRSARDNVISHRRPASYGSAGRID